MDEVQDKFGRKVNVGDFIIYGSVSGRSWLLQLGKVVALTADSIEVLGAGHDVLPWGKYITPLKDWKLNSKTGKLSHPRRVFVVPPDFVPEEIRQLFSEKGL